jgi:hypothetical protein
LKIEDIAGLLAVEPRIVALERYARLSNADRSILISFCKRSSALSMSTPQKSGVVWSGKNC